MSSICWRRKSEGHAVTGGIDMKVSDLLSNKIDRLVTGWPQQRLDAAAGLMAEQDIGILPITDGDHLVGMLSERDVSRAVAIPGRSVGELHVSEVMSESIVSCRPEDAVSVAMESMERRGVRHLAVLDAGGRLVGVISLRDVLSALLETTRSEAEAERERAILDRLRGMKSGPRTDSPG